MMPTIISLSPPGIVSSLAVNQRTNMLSVDNVACRHATKVLAKDTVVLCR